MSTIERGQVIRRDDLAVSYVFGHHVAQFVHESSDDGTDTVGDKYPCGERRMLERVIDWTNRPKGGRTTRPEVSHMI